MNQQVRPWDKKSAKPVAEPVNPHAALIDELAGIRAQKSHLETREKEIAEILRKLGDGDHKGGKVIAEITTTERETFDSKSFKEDHPDVAAHYLKTSSVTTIRIKPLV